MPSSVAYSETRTLANDNNTRALNGSYRLGRDPLETAPPRTDESRKNEDIFLNIARTDSGRRDSLGRSDFRRVSPLSCENHAHYRTTHQQKTHKLARRLRDHEG